MGGFEEFRIFFCILDLMILTFETKVIIIINENVFRNKLVVFSFFHLQYLTFQA
jgi:hypothetical protein